MPFYRITIWIEDQVLQGIREHPNSNIDYVTNLYRGKAAKEYGKKLIDVEAAMLSKNAAAVKEYLEQKLKEREHQKYWSNNLVLSPAKDRKKSSVSKPTLGEIAANQEKSSN